MSQFVSNIKSVVELVPSELTEDGQALPTKDYSITLEYDLNHLFSGLEIPYRPKTDSPDPVSGPDPEQNIEQDTIPGSSPAQFMTVIETLKAGWGVRPSSNGDDFSADMLRVLKYLLDPDSPGSLLESGNAGTTDGVSNPDYAAKLSSTKITKWLKETQGTGQSHKTFFDEVFKEDQVMNILSQIRNLHKYDADDGRVTLDEGSEVGVVVCLQTSDQNSFNLHLFLKQKSEYIEYETVPSDGAITSAVTHQTGILTLDPIYYKHGVVRGGSANTVFGTAQEVWYYTGSPNPTAFPDFY